MIEPTPLLSVENLVVRFWTHEGTIHAVNGVTFQLEEGDDSDSWASRRAARA